MAIWDIDKVKSSEVRRCFLIKDGNSFTALVGGAFFSNEERPIYGSIGLYEENQEAVLDFMSKYSPGTYEERLEAYLAAQAEEQPDDSWMNDYNLKTIQNNVLASATESMLGREMYYSKDGIIPVLDREKGQQLVSNSTSGFVIKQLAGKPFYISEDKLNVWKVPLEINGVEHSDQKEVYSVLADLGVYALYQGLCVAVEPVEFTLGTWQGTTFNEEKVSLGTKAYPIGTGGLSLSSSANDEIYETTKEGYFIVKAEDWPAGFYEVKILGSTGCSCLIEIR